MSIFISNNAIQNIPLTAESINEKFYLDELSSFLSKVDYLNLLAKGKAESLSLDSKSSADNAQAIRFIRIALEALDKDFGTDFDLPAGYYDSTYDRDRFEENLRDAIIVFQNWCGLNPNGVIDKVTLLAVDQKLRNEVYIDYLAEKYLGNNLSNASISVSRNFDEGTGQFQTSFSLKDSIVDLETDEIFTGRVIENNGYPAIEGNKISVLPSTKIQEQIKKTSDFKNLAIYPLDSSIVVQINLDDIKAVYTDQNNNITFTPIALQDAISELPPVKYEDPNEKPPYLVGQGDKLSDIILKNYYGQSYTIENPYDENEPIFTFPARNSLNDRNDDARFQFYTNLLYYYNTVEDQESGLVTEWGINKAPNYQRYDVNHLEEENVFNNLYDANLPETALPNYHRFLKRMETLNPNSKIEFDNAGQTTSFNLEVGKKVRIPSRQFADTLYYQLNFRQDLFLEQDPNNSEKLRYKPDLLDVIGNVASAITQTIKQSVIDLYTEASQFFDKAYNYVRDYLASYWPRGIGGALGGGIGITWGIPIATDLSVQNRLWRKMSPIDEFTIMYRKEGTFGIGADLAGGVSLGLYSGKGKKKRGVGLTAGAGASAMLNFKGVMEYEFPIRTEETALLSMAITVFGGTIVQTGVSVLNYFEVINLNPEQYVTKIDFGVNLDIEGWAAAQVDFGTPRSAEAITIGNESMTPIEEQGKGFFSFKNIFKSIPSVGLSADANFSVGMGFSIEYKYDYVIQDSPLVPSIDARVPSQMNISVEYQMKQSTSVNILGGLVSRMLFGATGVPAGLDGFLEFIFGNSDKRLGLVFEGKRNTSAISIERNDIDISNFGSDVSVANNGNGGLKYNKNGNFGWESYFKIGSYEGDPDTFGKPGSYSAVKFNLSNIKDLITGNASVYDLDDVLSVLHSYEKGFKLGADWDRRDRKGIFLAQTVTGSFGGNPVGTFQATELTRKANILSNANKDIIGFDFAAYLYVKVDLRMQDYQLFIKYYLRMVKLSYVMLVNQADEFREILNDLQKHKDMLVKAIAKKEKLAASPETLISKIGIEYFNLLFAEGHIYGDANLPLGMNGKMKSILNAEAAGAAELNFGNTIKFFVDGYKWFAQYYNDGRVPDIYSIIYGIKQLPEVWGYAASLTHLYTALEVEFGINLTAQLKVGIEALTVRLALSGELAIMDHSVFYEEGVFVIDNNPNDPYNLALQNIKNYLVDAASDKMGAISHSLIRHKIQ